MSPLCLRVSCACERACACVCLRKADLYPCGNIVQMVKESVGSAEFSPMPDTQAVRMVAGSFTQREGLFC